VTAEPKPPAILVTTYAGDPGVEQIARDAAAGLRPRKDYVELARRTAGIVVDAEHMAARARPAARRVAQRAGLPAGQVAEAFLRRGEYGGVLAWADRLGLPFALLCKLARSRRDTVLVSVALSNPKKALPMKALRLHTHLGAIVAKGTAQVEIAAERLGVPREKLHVGVHAVDERFWAPRDARPPAGGPVVAVGWEERDYPTLLRAAGTDVPVELAIGSIASSHADGIAVSPLGELPANVRLHANLKPRELRDLYARASLVVVPLRDVEFDAGVTAIAEAMAMGRPVVVTRTRGQRDLLVDGEQGVYVPPGDARAMREAIDRLSADPARAAAMGADGRALIERAHTLDRYVGELAALLTAGR